LYVHYAVIERWHRVH